MSAFNLKNMLDQLPWGRRQEKTGKVYGASTACADHHLGEGEKLESDEPDHIDARNHAAIYFTSGAPLLLPIDARLSDGIGRSLTKPFIGIATLDNRFVVIRTKAIAELFLWDESYGAPHAREGFADCLGEITHNDTFWAVLEHTDRMEAIEGIIDADTVQEAKRLAQAYAQAQGAEHERVRAALIDRARTYCWQHTANGALRSIADEGGCADEDLWVYVGASLYDTAINGTGRGTLPEWIKLPIHTNRLQVSINMNQVDYLWMPLHKLRAGHHAWGVME